MAKSLTFRQILTSDRPIVYRHKCTYGFVEGDWANYKSREKDFDEAIKTSRELFKELSNITSEVGLAETDHDIHIALFSYEDELMFSLKMKDFVKYLFILLDCFLK